MPRRIARATRSGGCRGTCSALRRPSPVELGRDQPRIDVGHRDAVGLQFAPQLNRRRANRRFGGGVGAVAAGAARGRAQAEEDELPVRWLRSCGSAARAMRSGAATCSCHAPRSPRRSVRAARRARRARRCSPRRRCARSLHRGLDDALRRYRARATSATSARTFRRLRESRRRALRAVRRAARPATRETRRARRRDRERAADARARAGDDDRPRYREDVTIRR